jgi:hypothetical protein
MPLDEISARGEGQADDEDSIDVLVIARFGSGPWMITRLNLARAAVAVHSIRQ